MEEQGCPLVRHPVKYAMAIGFKWIHFILALLNTEGLGNSVLPAFKAVTGTDAIGFMVFLMLVVFGTVQTYWALPIAQHLPKKGRSVFELVFMKVFRLELLGEFDIAELEGEAPQINGSFTGHQLQGQVGDARESPLFHDAIMIIVLFATVVVTVLSMNVAIGIVSTAYSQNKTNSNQLYCHFQAGYVFKLLLRRAAFRRWFPKCADWMAKCSEYLCAEWMPKCSEYLGLRRPITADEREADGYFVGFDGRWFMDAKDLDEELEALQTTIDEFRHKLDDMSRMIGSSGQLQKRRAGKVKKRR